MPRDLHGLIKISEEMLMEVRRRCETPAEIVTVCYHMLSNAQTVSMVQFIDEFMMNGMGYDRAMAKGRKEGIVK